MPSKGLAIAAAVLVVAVIVYFMWMVKRSPQAAPAAGSASQASPATPAAQATQPTWKHLTFVDSPNGYVISCPSGQNLMLKNFKYSAPNSSCSKDITSGIVPLITQGILSLPGYVADAVGDPCPGVAKQGDVDASCSGGGEITAFSPTPSGGKTITQSMPAAGSLSTTATHQLADSQSGGSITCAPKKLVFNKFRYGDPATNCWGDFTAMANANVNGGQSLSWTGYATSIAGVSDPCQGVPKTIDYDMSCY